MKRIITFIFLALPFLVSAQQKEQDSINYDKAYDFYEKEKYGSALMLVNPLISANPKSAKYYSLRGCIYKGMHVPVDALADFSTAILFDPHNFIYYSQRSGIYLDLQMADESIKDCDSSIKYAYNDTIKYELICNRGSAKYQKRDFQSAYDDYIQLYRFDSTNILALTSLGTVMDDLGRDDEAIAYLEKAMKCDPTFIGPIGNLGFRYSMKGDYVKALAMFKRVLELSPEDAVTLNNIGYVLYKMNDLPNALKSIQRSIELYPGNSYAYRNRALVYIAMKEKDKACEDLKQAVKQGFTEMYGDEVKKLILEKCI